MKIMERNKQKLTYLLFDHSESLVDEYGNETGESRVIYQEPIVLFANISPAGGTSQVEQFGNLTGYDKVVVTDDISCAIDENTVLFVDKEPEYKDGDPIYDYIVKRVAKSLNSISYAIARVDVS